MERAVGFSHQVIKLLSLYSVTPHEITSSLIGQFTYVDTQLYHEVDVAVLVAEILHEPLKSAFLSTHLEKH